MIDRHMDSFMMVTFPQVETLSHGLITYARQFPTAFSRISALFTQYPDLYLKPGGLDNVPVRPREVVTACGMLTEIGQQNRVMITSANASVAVAGLGLAGRQSLVSIVEGRQDRALANPLAPSRRFDPEMNVDRTAQLLGQTLACNELAVSIVKTFPSSLPKPTT